MVLKVFVSALLLASRHGAPEGACVIRKTVLTSACYDE
jgi:hypothetical protein